ncbi:MAG: hypothetical protein ACYC06_02270 [Ilumatobacteraceae bacterium]
MSNADKHPNSTNVIHIDRKQYKTDASMLTGAQLRTLPEPDISAEFNLWLEVPGGTDRIIDDEDVEICNGLHFYSIQRNTNPG